MNLFNLKLPWLLFLLIINVFVFEKILAGEIPRKVFEKRGNIYYVINHRVIQITTSGKDNHPILSPTNKTIAFVRQSDIAIPKGCGYISYADEYANQIWIYDIATKKEKLLVKNNFSCDKLEKLIIDPNDLQFSPDSKTIYFATSAWVTSGALHAININGTNLRYIAPANSYRVIYDGKYKNKLIILQHRYFPQGGSYDWYWLYTLQGKQIKALGPMD